MNTADSTCWTMLRDAAGGIAEARTEFAAHYAPMVRSYLAARWRGSPLVQETEDATQDVFVECLREGGVLDRAMPDRAGGFRAFLYGVVRNVALRVESSRARQQAHRAEVADLGAMEGREEALSRVFDRAWAKAIVRKAAELQSQWAAQKDAAAQERFELLRLRFQEGLPIRDIARLWQADPARLHHEFARARQEFEAALKEVMRFHHPGEPDRAQRELANLLALLE
jgi:RNA polymerase sigma-70 factor (ECF subfamily)